MIFSPNVVKSHNTTLSTVLTVSSIQDCATYLQKISLPIHTPSLCRILRQQLAYQVCCP